MAIAYRHSAGFGRRIEYWLISRMLREGLDVYIPLVDDFGIDAVIRKKDNHFLEVRIKARSRTVKEGDAALFAAIVHPVPRTNYYFVFYSERLDAMWSCLPSNSLQKLFRTRAGRTLESVRFGSTA
jgi:hypothetical protein